jgi:hypothetical protein
VHHSTGGDEFKRQRIPRFDIHIVITGNNRISYSNVIGGQDVTPLPIGVTEKRNAGGTVGVIFNGLDPCRDTMLGPLKINYPIKTSVTTSPMVTGNSPGIVSPTAALHRLAQLLLRFGFRNFLKCKTGRETSPRRCGRIVFNGHI